MTGAVKITEKALLETTPQSSTVILEHNGVTHRIAVDTLLGELLDARRTSDGSTYAKAGDLIRSIEQGLTDLEEELQDTIGRQVPDGLMLDEDSQLWLTVGGQEIGDPVDLSSGIGSGGGTAGDTGSTKDALRGFYKLLPWNNLYHSGCGTGYRTASATNLFGRGHGGTAVVDGGFGVQHGNQGVNQSGKVYTYFAWR